MQDSDRQQTHRSPARSSAHTAAAVAAQTIQPSSPRFFFSSAAAANPSAASHRRIAIAVDLSDESAYAVKWAVQNYLRPGDAVILLHVRPTSVLYGADWGSIGDLSPPSADNQSPTEESQQKLEDDFAAFTATKAQDLAQPLVDSQIPFKIHIVKDHNMKERLCLEVERLGLSAVIMGSRGFGASRRGGKGRLGSVSDYCVRHCVCPVVVVRYPDDGNEVASDAAGPVVGEKAKEVELNPLPKEDRGSTAAALRAEGRNSADRIYNGTADIIAADNGDGRVLEAVPVGDQWSKAKAGEGHGGRPPRRSSSSSSWSETAERER